MCTIQKGRNEVNSIEMTSHSLIVTLSKAGNGWHPVRDSSRRKKLMNGPGADQSYVTNSQRHLLDGDSVTPKWIVMFHHPLDSSRKSVLNNENLNFVGRLQHLATGSDAQQVTVSFILPPKTEVCHLCWFPAHTLISQFARRNGPRQGTALAHDLSPTGKRSADREPGR